MPRCVVCAFPRLFPHTVALIVGCNEARITREALVTRGQLRGSPRHPSWTIGKNVEHTYPPPSGRTAPCRVTSQTVETPVVVPWHSRSVTIDRAGGRQHRLPNACFVIKWTALIQRLEKHATCLASPDARKRFYASIDSTGFGEAGNAHAREICVAADISFQSHPARRPRN
eukprot:scaffold206280_cov28-Tisochrysis_lutea.AAC.3